MQQDHRDFPLMALKRSPLSTKGRVPTARRQSAEIMRLKDEGKTVPQIMAALGVSRASVYRVVQQQNAAQIV